MTNYMVFDVTDGKTLIAGLTREDAIVHTQELSAEFPSRKFSVRKDRRA